MFGRGEKKQSSSEIDSAKASSSKDEFQLQPIETVQTTYDQAFNGELYRDGKLVLLPAPTRDPNDPLNLPFWRKVVGLMSLSFFGALIASAELILGACLPVFALAYSPLYHYDPKEYFTVLIELGVGFPYGSNPLKFLDDLGGPPIFSIYLLATIPVLVIGVSNLFLVPLAITAGRRPVILGAGLIAIGGACWAGESTTLGTHVGARCLQAVGAGTVESLVPFIIQDFVHVHERNTWISAAFACQGVIIIAIGISTPYIIINLDWRWVYHITAITASFFWIGMFFFLPETRFSRTRSEMNGVPRNDAGVSYRPRTWAKDLNVFSHVDVRKGVMAFVDTIRTFFYPSILFVTLLNGSVIASAFAAGFTAAPALLTEPWAWPFYHLGLALLAVLVGAIFVPIITGRMADIFSNSVAKARGHRVPENQLINLFLPWACALVGAVLFGISGDHQNDYPWIVFLLALGFMAFGFLGINTITTVYVLECYPHMAGPALVNVASFRWIMAFLLTLWASDWINDMGYLKTFSIYVGLIAGFGLLIPVVYVFGPAWRRIFPGRQGASTDTV